MFRKNCGTELPEDSVLCGIYKEPRPKKFIVAGILSVLILAVVAAGFFLHSSSQKGLYLEQLDLGQRYLETGDYKAAIVALTKAIEIEPRQAQAYVVRGNTYVLQGETEENLSLAQADYEMAISLDNTNAQGYLGLADVFIRRGDYDAAVDILERAQNVTDSEAISNKLKSFERGMIWDTQGRLRRKIYYDENGNLAWYHEYSYDSLGRKSAVTLFDSSGKQRKRVEVLYDENGNCIQEEEGFDAIRGRLFTITYEVDSSGRNIKGTTYGPDGDWQYDTFYEYDGNNRVIKESRYYPSGEMIDYKVFEYDEEGKLAGIVTYAPNGSVRRSDKY